MNSWSILNSLNWNEILRSCLISRNFLIIKSSEHQSSNEIRIRFDWEKVIELYCVILCSHCSTRHEHFKPFIDCFANIFIGFSTAFGSKQSHEKLTKTSNIYANNKTINSSLNEKLFPTHFTFSLSLLVYLTNVSSASGANKKFFFPFSLLYRKQINVLRKHSRNKHDMWN